MTASSRALQSSTHNNLQPKYLQLAWARGTCDASSLSIERCSLEDQSLERQSVRESPTNLDS